ncbi:hypothetical protein IGI04_003160 [Brassica rapa subsp. trilocularis]|uniref:Uncharacterized protein n=1 Tax=Brassica rapa subsp. trilocularis TaxID=1813537 RepID=A0ABQ7NXJ8_BRACM|nr:hypothetical protein IGI04_003160 [Brassica rapa subsp. trilocularis]
MKTVRPDEFASPHFEDSISSIASRSDDQMIFLLSTIDHIDEVKDDSGEANFLLFDANAQQINEDEDFLPEAVSDLFGKRVLFEISVDADTKERALSMWFDWLLMTVLMLESADDISSGSGGFTATPLSKRKSEQDEDSCLEDQHSVNKKLSQKKLKGE